MDSTASTPQTPPIPTVPLDVTEQQKEVLLDDTLHLLDADVTKKKDQQHGLAEVGRWEEVLRASDHPGLAKIIQELVALREQLTAPERQNHDIAETLAVLGAETIKVAEEASNNYTNPLKKLAKLLIQLGNTLSK